ncbi:MAG: hypothetical protein ACUVQY_01275 [Thermoproteota archaeon]
MLGFKASRFAEIVVASGMKPSIRLSDIRLLCDEALKHGIKEVCIPTAYCKEVSGLIRDTSLRTSTIISFPAGLLPVELKIAEIRLASEYGIDEAFFYPNIGNYMDNRIDFEWELSKIIEGSQLIGLKSVKPIVEAESISEREIGELIDILRTTGFDTLGISSGFGLREMRDKELSLLRIANDSMMVEAVCRVRSIGDLQGLIENGACRIYTLDYDVISKEASENRLRG